MTDNDLRQIANRLKDEMHPGEQRRLHHCRFESGKDKLYVDMTLDGSMLLMKCHHCGAAAGFRINHNKPSLARLFKDRSPSVSSGYRSVEVPKDCIAYEGNLLRGRIPADAAVMMDRWKLPLCFVPLVLYSPGMHRLILPCINMAGERTGWQARRLSLKSNHCEIKWITSGMPGYCRMMNGMVPDEAPIFLVEDIPSAMHLALHGVIAIALLGTNVTARLLSDLIINKNLTRKRTIFVWLDNDKPVVVEAAQKIRVLVRDTLMPEHAKTVIVLSEEAEPKHLNSKEVGQRIALHSRVAGIVL